MCGKWESRDCGNNINLQFVEQPPTRQVPTLPRHSSKIFKVSCDYLKTFLYSLREKGNLYQIKFFDLDSRVMNEWESLLFEAKPVQDTGVSDGKG